MLSTAVLVSLLFHLCFSSDLQRLAEISFSFLPELLTKHSPPSGSLSSLKASQQLYGSLLENQTQLFSLLQSLSNYLISIIII